MTFKITYQLYDFRDGKPDGHTLSYTCKDAADYARCVRLYKDGEVFLKSVNGRKITTQDHYPSRRSIELKEKAQD